MVADRVGLIGGGDMRQGLLARLIKACGTVDAVDRS